MVKDDDKKVDCHALIVDDNSDLCFVMQMRLEVYGVRVTTASSGRAAVNAAVNTSTDIVFVDFDLPDMNGIEVIREIRNAVKKAPYFVIHSGHAPETFNKEFAIDSSVTILTKPISTKSLLDVLMNAQQKKEEQGDIDNLVT